MIPIIIHLKRSLDQNKLETFATLFVPLNYLIFIAFASISYVLFNKPLSIQFRITNRSNKPHLIIYANDLVLNSELVWYPGYGVSILIF
jgi:hypothetical protein